MSARFALRLAWSVMATAVAVFPAITGLLWPESWRAEYLADAIDALARAILWVAIQWANPWNGGAA